jgi:hypothetical protein
MALTNLRKLQRPYSRSNAYAAMAPPNDRGTTPSFYVQVQNALPVYTSSYDISLKADALSEIRSPILQTGQNRLIR